MHHNSAHPSQIIQYYEVLIMTPICAWYPDNAVIINSPLPPNMVPYDHWVLYRHMNPRAVSHAEICTAVGNMANSTSTKDHHKIRPLLTIFQKGIILCTAAYSDLRVINLAIHRDYSDQLRKIRSVCFCCRNCAADISKPHAFKWGPLADEVLTAP